ncbi:MAG TPA: hypothetical protein VH765_02955 [Xanthobacteraceae bacterium]
MSNQRRMPNPFDIMALGWGITMAYASLFLASMYPERMMKRSREDERTAPDKQAPDKQADASEMTPEEEELLLHVID